MSSGTMRVHQIVTTQGELCRHRGSVDENRGYRISQSIAVIHHRDYDSQALAKGLLKMTEQTIQPLSCAFPPDYHWKRSFLNCPSLSAPLLGSMHTIQRTFSPEPLWVCVRQGRFHDQFYGLIFLLAASGVSCVALLPWERGRGDLTICPLAIYFVNDLVSRIPKGLSSVTKNIFYAVNLYDWKPMRVEQWFTGVIRIKPMIV
ncbi:hypothetical protein AVEN_244648-1 [Araneus ventricosus]|uniref:Uncharacterized protein n=1 Tax=Araneus ventricosus TaxID=182803 RepID=A0A4Y2NXZ8_ARAVE|nr:hypothetical protein AVEN_244648-1 [Araneus ventricosus]